MVTLRTILLDTLAFGLDGVFLYVVLTRLGRLQRRTRVMVAALIAVAAVATLGGSFASATFTPTRGRWLYRITTSGTPVFLYLSLTLLAVLVVNLIWAALARRDVASARPRVVRTLTGVAVVVALIITGSGYVTALTPRLAPYTITSDQLPAAFDGFTIALITDLHVGPTIDGTYVRRVVDLVNAAQPDFIVLAGDLVDGTPAQLMGDLRPLNDLAAPYGAVVTTGNHELLYNTTAWVAAFASLGLTVLNNDGIELTRGGSAIDVLGINDYYGKRAWAPDLALANQRLANAFGTPLDGQGRYRILVAHEPRQATADDDLAARIGVDLQLSGHTHGGQFWPLGLYQEAVQGMSGGVTTLGGITVVDSGGLGSSGTPVRVGAPPTVPLITLRTR